MSKQERWGKWGVVAKQKENTFYYTIIFAFRQSKYIHTTNKLVAICVVMAPCHVRGLAPDVWYFHGGHGYYYAVDSRKMQSARMVGSIISRGAGAILVKASFWIFGHFECLIYSEFSENKDKPADYRYDGNAKWLPPSQSVPAISVFVLLIERISNTAYCYSVGQLPT